MLHRRHFSVRVVSVLAVGMLATLAIQGCSSDDKKPVSLTVTASEPSAGNYAFDVPSSLEGGVMKIDFKNTGKETHEIQFVRVKEGTTPDQFTKEVLDTQDSKIPDYLLEAGGVGAILPGKSATLTEKFTPGSYIFFCTIGNGDVVHYKHGMIGTTTIKDDKGKGDLPKADGSIKAREYGFDIAGLKAGDNTVAFENTGKEFHHAFIAPIAAGKTFDDVKNALTSDQQSSGPPPVEVDKAIGLSVLTPGGKLVQTNVSLEKGKYVVLCFLTDRAGGPPHFQKGMMQELDVS